MNVKIVLILPIVMIICSLACKTSNSAPTTFAESLRTGDEYHTPGSSDTFAMRYGTLGEGELLAEAQLNLNRYFDAAKTGNTNLRQAHRDRYAGYGAYFAADPWSTSEHGTHLIVARFKRNAPVRVITKAGPSISEAELEVIRSSTPIIIYPFDKSYISRAIGDGDDGRFAYATVVRDQSVIYMDDLVIVAKNVAPESLEVPLVEAPVDFMDAIIKQAAVRLDVFDQIHYDYHSRSGWRPVEVNDLDLLHLAFGQYRSAMTGRLDVQEIWRDLKIIRDFVDTAFEEGLDASRSVPAAAVMAAKTLELIDGNARPLTDVTFIESLAANLRKKRPGFLEAVASQFMIYNYVMQQSMDHGLVSWLPGKPDGGGVREWSPRERRERKRPAEAAPETESVDDTRVDSNDSTTPTSEARKGSTRAR